jgi:hypothetical protein
VSLRPTRKNVLVVGLALSAEVWAHHAIGGDKGAGPEGFERYTSQGGWNHAMHYRHITTHPSLSPPEAVAEMSRMRECLVEEIINEAKIMDALVMRLQRMEEQMAEVIANAKEVVS